MKLVSEAWSADTVVNKNILFVLALWLCCWSNWIPTYLPTPLFALHVQHAVLTKVASLVLALPFTRGQKTRKARLSEKEATQMTYFVFTDLSDKDTTKIAPTSLHCIVLYFKWIGCHLRCDWVDTLYTLVVTSVVVLSSAPPRILNLGKTNIGPADIFTFSQL